jgi:hypothetical protein
MPVTAPRRRLRTLDGPSELILRHTRPGCKFAHACNLTAPLSAPSPLVSRNLTLPEPHGTTGFDVAFTFNVSLTGVLFNKKLPIANKNLVNLFDKFVTGQVTHKQSSATLQSTCNQAEKAIK